MIGIINEKFKSTNKFDLNVAYKIQPLEGNLVYEYNPFYNYRLDKDMFFYKNRFYTPEQLAYELGIEGTRDNEKKETTDINWDKVNLNNYVPNTETPPIFYQKGQLTDFVTNELQFDINHPVSILPSYSYDNSVDLILNDGKNQPRLINSRFSATERNQYKVNDRDGNNDTNIYDQGSQFDVDTSLYKKITTIPKLDLLSIGYGGNLPIGNYNFYFKYVDDDGNESDIFAESAQVQIFIGSFPSSIQSGFRLENSHKTVNFILTNLDSAYQNIKVYYTRATSDIHENVTINAYVIEQPYLCKTSIAKISITGYESSHEVPIEEINEVLQRYSAVGAQTTCQNMLFFAHNYKIKKHHKELKDLALRFLPYLDKSLIYTSLNPEYKDNITNTYYNPQFTYKYTGYWSDIYRLGIVFMYSDYTLSDVYNVRGCEELQDILNTEHNFQDIPIKDDNGIRRYIKYNEETFLLDEDKEPVYKLENVKGVVKFPNNIKLNEIVGIKFKVDKKVINYLRDSLNIVGFFFVRQKRIPTILCQAYMLGIDKQSCVPVIPIEKKNSFDKYIGKVETFLDKDRILTNDQSNRWCYLEKNQIRKEAAICPEYDVNYPYYNSLFTGEQFVVEPYTELYYPTEENINDIEDSPSGYFYTCQILGIEDNVKLVAIGDKKFSARAGEAEEAFRYEYVGKENRTTEATNLVRGSFGPYLGITGLDDWAKLVNIRIPYYRESDMDKYFRIRYEDPYPYYAISDRIDINNFSTENIYTDDINSERKDYILDTCYRGDCFICNYTHRLNRNFSDPSAPINDTIVDSKCWKNNYEVKDKVVNKEKFSDINLGDVNAIQLGSYINLVIKSNINLNIRGLDNSIPDEMALYGHARTFTPYSFNPIEGPYKIPEALCYNKGLEKSVSEKVYFRMPDVPFIQEDFTNRISYSNIKVANSFQNGMRVFKGQHYRDYSKEYGSIIELVEWGGNLVAVCEHGILLIAVNERAVAAEGAQGLAYINTSNVLPENPQVISDKYGSQWKESIVKTPNYIYGVDTVARKIWRTNGRNIEYISDHRISEFLNNNISLTERELTPIVGIRNVKSHYNEFKKDVMFTFYDNLYGFEEKVWNICFNEAMDKWITFYSWVPSYSENIYNSFFSFDRNTSKWIAKLGISKSNNSFSDGIVLDNNIIKDWNKFTISKSDLITNPEISQDESVQTVKHLISRLSLVNRSLPAGDGVTNTIKFTLERDNYGNYGMFKIDEIPGEPGVYGLYTTATYKQLCSELFLRTNKNKEKIYPDSEEYNLNLKVYKDDSGKRINLKTRNEDRSVNADKIVYLLNVRAEITTSTDKVVPELKDTYEGSNNLLNVDAGYYQSTIAVIPEYNLQFLSTDFWRHGQAGIIDIADNIYPTYWYGKQHPFEFEFVVADKPGSHKIFDNLQIISNKAEPESFHYEIVGECYDFAKDKKNMYIRQEATKELYQYNGSDIVYDREYSKLESEHRPIREVNPDITLFDKSTIFPLYYCRQDTINDIEDYYHLYKDEYSIAKKNFSALAGAEIVRYKNLNEYRICNHAKAVNINNQEKGGRMRGNMQYKEDIWNVQINPINIVQKNESMQDWENKYRLNDNDKITYNNVPAELNLFKDSSFIPDNRGSAEPPILELPRDWTRNIVSWKEYERLNKEVKIKDKFMKVKIRYTGDDLAIITAINTLYSISYA